MKVILCLIALLLVTAFAVVMGTLFVAVHCPVLAAVILLLVLWGSARR